MPSYMDVRKFVLRTSSFVVALGSILMLSPASAQSKAPTASAAAAPQQAKAGLTANTIDGVIVTVGEEPILLSELQQRVAAVTQGTTRLSPLGQLTGGQLVPADAEMLLEQLINQKILSLRVQELGLNVGEDELDSELKSFLKSRNISEETLAERLRAEGMTVDEHREDFRREIETQRFIGRVIRPLVSVSDDQILAYYMAKNADKEKSQLIKLRRLMIELPAGLSNEESQAKKRNIETIRRDIDAGRPFVELVKIYSEDKDFLKNEGLLPARPLTDFPEKLRTELAGKKAPFVLGPIKIGTSIFFFEYLGTELGDQKEYERMKPQYEAKLLDEKFRERLEEYLKNERLKVKVTRRNFAIKN